MSQKKITNETMLRDLLKSLHTLEAALLRERIQCIADMTRQAIEENPSKYDNPVCSHKVYLGLCDKIDKHLQFKK